MSQKPLCGWLESNKSRNWDYRFCWVRDSSFTIYILLRMGFTAEADAYMAFISKLLKTARQPDGALPIMFTIRGETEIPELELDHLDGYRGSKPVRIGNGAAFHQQFDIYGELMDGIYLYNKYGRPVTWEQWVSVREIVDYALKIKDGKLTVFVPTCTCQADQLKTLQNLICPFGKCEMPSKISHIQKLCSGYVSIEVYVWRRNAIFHVQTAQPGWKHETRFMRRS